MKLFFLAISFFSFVYLNAVEVNKDNFPLIQPISVETATKTTKGYFADLDKDGVSDDKDKCQETPTGANVDIFGCIILDDNDRDGVSNVDDKCPNSQDGATVNLDGCEPDNDNDGVPDSIDKCPYTTEEFSVDKVGCPKSRILNIEFNNNNNALSPQSLEIIDEFAELLNENIGYQVIIYSFTDNTKDEQVNKKITKSRAKTVMNALIKREIKLTRLTAIGMGSKDPISDNDTDEGQAKNNRIEVEILQ